MSLLFNKNNVAKLVLTMGQIFNHLVFILGGNEDHDGIMVGAGAQKWQEQDAMQEIKKGLIKTIRGQRHEKLNFLCLNDELWVCIVVIIVFMMQLGKNAPL